MAAIAKPAPLKEPVGFNPNDLVDRTGTLPSFHFDWREPGKKKGQKVPPNRQKKRRLICIPNRPMIALHKLFKTHLEAAIDQIGDGNDGSDNYTLRRLPSSTGCVVGSNHYKNSSAHASKKYFYITDFAHAYPSVDLRRLTMLLVFIFNYREHGQHYTVRSFGRNALAQYATETDPLFPYMESFVKMAFGGMRGEGLAVGGPLSPYLLNLYCEVYLDGRIRQYLEKLEDKRDPDKQILYTRYVDDLVFSSNRPIYFGRREELRRMIAEAGFSVNHRKSRLEDLEHGTVFVTKVGLETRKGKPSLVFPKEKRWRLEGLLKSHLRDNFHKDIPEVAAGLIAEFLHYYKLVTVDPADETKRIPPSKSDKRTFRLCKEFENVLGPYLKQLRYARQEGQEKKAEDREREKELKRVIKSRSRRARRT